MKTQIENALKALWTALSKEDKRRTEDALQRLADVVSLAFPHTESLDQLHEIILEGWLNNRVELSDGGEIVLHQTVDRFDRENRYCTVNLSYDEGYVHAFSFDPPISVCAETETTDRSKVNNHATVHVLFDGMQVNQKGWSEHVMALDVDVNEAGVLKITTPNKIEFYAPGQWEKVYHLRNIEPLP